MERAIVDEYTPHCQRFVLASKDYVQQYNQLYLARLHAMKPALSARAISRWGSSVRILNQIIDIEDTSQLAHGERTTTAASALASSGGISDGGGGGRDCAVECVIIGTIYKDMQLRGSILDEFKEQGGISGPVKPLAHITSQSDSLVLEDASGRIALALPECVTEGEGGEGDGDEGWTVGRLVTGVVAAVRGTVDDLGVMQVTGMAFAHSVTAADGPGSHRGHGQIKEGSKGCCVNEGGDAASSWPSVTPDSRFVLLVSGLLIGNPPVPDQLAAADGLSRSDADAPGGATSIDAGASELSMQLLADFVTGRLSSSADVDIASRIIRVVIAGDSMGEGESAYKNSRVPSHPTGAGSGSGAKRQRLSLSPSKQLDLQLGQLLSCVHVDMMPGPQDPTNLSMPQQPLHPCLFPLSCRFEAFQRVTNPYEALLRLSSQESRKGQKGVGVGNLLRLLGTSGQPISDIARQSRRPGYHPKDSKDRSTNEMQQCNTEVKEEAQEELVGAQLVAERLDILQDTLAWGHLCPSCPDTLACYPYTDVDPFVIFGEGQPLPNLLFAGNQPGFGSRLVRVNPTSTPTISSKTATATTTTTTTTTTAAPDQLVRLVTVPVFAESGVAVLVEVSSPHLPCYPISLK